MAQPARTPTASMTVEEFLAYPTPEGKSELVRGELRVTPPAGGPHGKVGVNLVLLLGPFVKQRQVGHVFGDGVGYELLQLPRTVRVPDASFVRAGRLPVEGVGPGIFRFAPDLAIEVLSPSETASELEQKVEDYLAAGTALIWVADPMRRTVRVIAAGEPERRLHEGDTLDGGAVLPGFACAVADVFEGIARDA